MFWSFPVSFPNPVHLGFLVTWQISRWYATSVHVFWRIMWVTVAIASFMQAFNCWRLFLSWFMRWGITSVSQCPAVVLCVQRTAPQGSPRTPAICIAASTPGRIFRILNSVFLNNSVTLTRYRPTPWWWSVKIETCRSTFMCFNIEISILDEYIVECEVHVLVFINYYFDTYYMIHDPFINWICVK